MASNNKPVMSFYPNDPFESVSEALDEHQQLSLDNLNFEDLLDKSMYWFIGSTIEDTVLAAIELVHAGKFNDIKLSEFGSTLRNLNTTYYSVNGESGDAQKFIGHRFLLLAVYKYPDYSAVIARLLYSFLLKIQSDVANLIMRKLLDGMNEILRRITPEDEALDKYEVEYKLMACKYPESHKERKELFRRLTLQRYMVQNRMVVAAKFFGYLFLSRLISENDFDSVFLRLRDGAEDIYKFEASCHFLLISGQFTTDIYTNDGKKYTFVLGSERNFENVYGLRFLELTCRYLNLTVTNFHSGEDTHSKTVSNLFKKLSLFVHTRNKLREKKIIRFNAQKFPLAPAQDVQVPRSPNVDAELTEPLESMCNFSLRGKKEPKLLENPPQPCAKLKTLKLKRGCNSYQFPDFKNLLGGNAMKPLTMTRHAMQNKLVRG